MEVKKNQQLQLKNKFLKAEMSVNDGELGYKLTPEKINQITSVKEKEIPIVFLYGGFILRTLKIFLNLLLSAFKFINLSIIVPVIKEIQKTLSFSANKIAEIKEQSEINLEERISKIEASILAQEEKGLDLNRKTEEGFQSYENELRNIFNDVDNKIILSCEKKEFEKVNPSLEFDISLYEIMARKLAMTKMFNNIQAIKVETVVEEKNVRHTLTFELKTMGEKWSKIFAKYLASEVATSIQNYNGIVTNIYSHNKVTKMELFVFTFTHHRLDIFMDSSKGEREIKNTSRLNKSLHLDNL